MKLWPFRNFSFETDLKMDEVIRRLHAEIGPRGAWLNIGFYIKKFGSDSRCRFEGFRTPRGGEIRLNLDGLMGYLRASTGMETVVAVHVRPQDAGASVSGTMGVFDGQPVWMVFPLLFVATAGLLLAFGVGNLSPIQAAAWFGLVLAIYGAHWLFGCRAFQTDSQIIETWLRTHLAGERDIETAPALPSA